MQTISVQIQDGFIQNFMSYVKSHTEKITIVTDENLELDPYFYERKKQLQKDLQEVENGTAQMISHDDLWTNINKHLDTLK